MTTKDRMYGLTYANAEAMAKTLGNGSIGFAPLQRFKMGSTYNPNRRPLVHCLSDHMLTRHGEAACLNVLPAYENRSRKAREYIQSRAQTTTASTNGYAAYGADTRTANTRADATVEGIVAGTTETNTQAADNTAEDTQADTVEDTTTETGGLDAMIRAIIREESKRAARNGTAGTNAEEVARISQTLIDAAIEKAKLPTTTHIVIHRADTTGRVETANLGVQHNQFPRLLALVQNRIAGPTSRRVNVWMPGPAGSGKTTAAENLAKALGIPYFYTPAIYDKMDVYGYCTADGEYVATDFFRAYTQGGVFLWDEADASDPSASVTINAAADGMLASFPHGMFKRHPDFVFLAAANTYGMGATAQYVGRNQLDAATLDRFIPLAWDYCPALEKVIVPDDFARDTMHRIRKAVADKQLNVVISTRAGMRHSLLRGMSDTFTEAQALETAYRGGMNADQWRQVAAAAGIQVGTVRELAA